MRQTIPLNFNWRFKPHHDPQTPVSTLLEEGFETVDLPHSNTLLPYSHFDEAEYQFVSVYQKIFDSPKLPEGHRLFVRFYGVSVSCEVSLNGVVLGRHEGAYTPFAFELTTSLREEGENCLSVLVDSREQDEVPPFGNVVDYLVYGGIYREVELEIRPEQSIDSCFIRTFDHAVAKKNDMIMDISFTFSKPLENAVLRFDLLKDGNAQRHYEKREIHGDTTRLQAVASDVERWDLDQPTLYHLSVELLVEGEVVDTVIRRFGFRTFAFTEEGFVLNNRKVKLIGLNRHQSYPYVGYAMPQRIQAKDAEILKRELFVNIVRCSHYMQSDAFLDACDELGLLVFEEIPGWQHIGGEAFKRRSLENLEVMITHHFNHPSIVLWGVRINESPDDHEFYQAMNELSRLLDDSRPTGGVRNFAGSELLEDVYTYNDFHHSGANEGLDKPRNIAKGLVPYLVTEHNGHMFPTKKFDNEARRAEQARRHLNVLDSAFSFTQASGAIGWCFADYNTHVEFGSGDHICHHGVMDMFRIPKHAAYVYASQNDAVPVLHAASNMIMGEYPGTAIPPTELYTNCDYVKVYKNDEYIDQFYPDWITYGNIPHPPVIVDDYIANRIRDHEPYTPKVAEMIKDVLLAYTKHGIRLTPKAKLTVAKLALFHKVAIKDLMRLFGKYIGDWGSKGSVYRYDGYLQDQLVVSQTVGASGRPVLMMKADDLELRPKKTYDATRIVVRVQDRFGNDLPYVSLAIAVETSASLRVIGPKIQALIGGSIGVYVRTTGAAGEGTVTIHAEGYASQTVSIRIETE
jgi:beta-galactosidase